MAAIESNLRLRVLILSKDLSAEGGVANSVRIQMENFSKNIQAEHFSIGNSDGITSKLHGSYLAILGSFRLFRKLSQVRYDCIQINPSLNARSLLRDGLFLFTILVSGFKNTIVFFRGWEEETEVKIRKNMALRFLFKRALYSVPLILVLGKNFKKSLIDMGISHKKIEVVTNFFDGNIFKSIKRRGKPNGRDLLFLSRFVKEKGVFEMLSAFKLIVSEFPDTRLILAGDGPEAKSLKKRSEEYGIEKNIKILGYVRGSNKGEVLINSDIFILPTYDGEGCPRALLEAMAAGLPVITCPVGGIPDIFTDKENGIFLSEVSPTEIADAVRCLLQDSELSTRISENNRQYAWENLEVGLGIKKIERMYSEVVAQNTRV